MTRGAGGWRPATAAATIALCGVFLAPGAARADIRADIRTDVTVTPDQAVRGDAAKLIFRVTDERGAAYTTKIELLLPEAAPIAEVWPLTVPDWAPSVVTRKLDRPLDGLHHGRVSEVTSQITWIRAEGAPRADAAELQVSLGPMPETDRMLFAVVQTYSDGAVVRWDAQPAADGSRVENQGALLTLVAPTAAPGGASGGAHGGTHGGDSGTTSQGGVSGESDDDAGGGFGSLATGLLIGLAMGGGVAIWLARGRRGHTSGRAGAATEEAATGEAATDGPAATGNGAESGTTDGDGGGVDGDRQPVASRRAWRLHE